MARGFLDLFWVINHSQAKVEVNAFYVLIVVEIERPLEVNLETACGFLSLFEAV